MEVAMKIYVSRNTETLIYAASELAKYLHMMDESITAEIAVGVVGNEGGGIALGLLEELSLPTDGVVDAVLDDVTDIDVKALSGHIAGSNERSVLTGVYNFLKSAGCLWVRPGDDGEYIPKKSMKDHSFVWRKKADFCFRGQCLEGAVSFEHVRDAILWMPKINSNLFMIQFVVPYSLMSRWYKHEGNTLKADEEPTYEQIKSYVPKIEAVVKKCGFQLHSLGHGYIFEPYGVHYKTRNDTYDYSEKCLSHTALVNGKRGIFRGSPNFTQLCYSNPEVRKLLVDYLVQYTKERPYMDYLQIWLADYVNNNCECEECQKFRVADYYVMLLNELDAALTENGIDTRLVLISYTETLWPPVKERLNHPERFTLNATASRKYSYTYSDKRYYDELPEYKRNNFTPLLNFSKVMSHTDAWTKICGGKKFLFEYFLYTNHFCDPGTVGVARELYCDMKNLHLTGFDGIMSCQTQRAAFPTALPTAIFTETLYDQQIEFDDYADAHFKAAFGEEYGAAKAYLERLTVLFDHKTTRATDSIEAQDTGAVDAAQTVGRNFGIFDRPCLAKNLAEVAPLCEKMAIFAKEQMEKSENICHKRSWELLEKHTTMAKLTADIYIAMANCDKDLAKEKFKIATDTLSAMEDDIHREFDLHLWHQIMTKTLNK